MTPRGVSGEAGPGGTGRRGQRFRAAGQVLGIAHRGASRYAPENTLAAFRLALGHGAPAVECDVQRTRDGHLVVIHDQALDRTTNGRGPVGAHSLEELRRLDAGGWFAPEHAGERIPLLGEVLEAVRERALLVLELKNGPVFYDGIESQIVDAIRRQGMEEDVFVWSFDHRSLRTVRECSPRIATAIAYAARLVDAPAAAAAAGADALTIGWAYLTEDVVAQARAADLGIFAWTVNDEETFRRCRALGADGIASDDSRLLGRMVG